jgi:hypothetical protein
VVCAYLYWERYKNRIITCHSWHEQNHIHSYEDDRASSEAGYDCVTGQLLQLTQSCKKPKNNISNRLHWDVEIEQENCPKEIKRHKI